MRCLHNCIIALLVHNAEAEVCGKHSNSVNKAMVYLNKYSQLSKSGLDSEENLSETSQLQDHTQFLMRLCGWTWTGSDSDVLPVCILTLLWCFSDGLSSGADQSQKTKPQRQEQHFITNRFEEKPEKSSGVCLRKRLQNNYSSQHAFHLKLPPNCPQRTRDNTENYKNKMDLVLL